CLRCFYMKIVKGVRRPATPFPSMFTKIDRVQRNFFDGRGTEAVDLALPPGTTACQGLSVRSSAIAIPGHRTSLCFKGAMDGVFTFEAGGFGILDFKAA